MQQQRFQDCYSTTFSTYPSMLSYHEMQSQASLWTRCPVNDLYVEPLDLASALAAEDGFAPGISKEAVYDTMENLGLAIRVNGAYYPVRETAYRSLLGRAKIGGTALPKLERMRSYSSAMKRFLRFIRATMPIIRCCRSMSCSKLCR